MKRSSKLPRRRKRALGFELPLTVSHPELLLNGSDDTFRETIYMMSHVVGCLDTCRQFFGRANSLTGSQFVVLYGVAYRQDDKGVSIRALADYVHLAPTHVTTEVGRLIQRGLLSKKTNELDRRGVLVQLSAKGEATIASLAPLLRRVNDILFRGVSTRQLQATLSFFQKLGENTDDALAEIDASEHSDTLFDRRAFSQDRK